MPTRGVTHTICSTNKMKKKLTIGATRATGARGETVMELTNAMVNVGRSEGNKEETMQSVETVTTARWLEWRPRSKKK